MDDLIDAIARRDVRALLQILLHGDPPALARGYRTESDLVEAKAGLPARRGCDVAWAKVALHVLGFHNRKGGVLLFGIDDRLYQFVGTKDYVDGSRFNDRIRAYVGDSFYVPFHREFPQPDGRYLGVAIVPPRDLVVVPFQSDSPLAGGKRIFRAGDVPMRENDSTRVYSAEDAAELQERHHVPALDSNFIVDEPGYRILRPDYAEFVPRPRYTDAIFSALEDRRTFITSITGIGGAGKTALAVWAVLQGYKRRTYDFIISTSSKDRFLSPDSGIRSEEPLLSTLQDILAQLAEVLGVPGLLEENAQTVVKETHALLEGEKVLFFVDNLETLEDPRVIEFLENLPDPCRAIVTSRRHRVRSGARVIDVHGLTAREGRALFRSLAKRRGRYELAELPDAEVDRIAAACSKLPLAIEWVVARTTSAKHAVSEAKRLMEGSSGEELLEFCFRRIHNVLSSAAQTVLAVLCIYPDIMPLEALSRGSGLSPSVALDATEELRSASLVDRHLHAPIRDWAYKILPVTRAFARRELGRQGRTENQIRRRLEGWYRAIDVKDPVQRDVERQRRLGRREPEAFLLQDGQQRLRRGEVMEALRLFRLALTRSPRNPIANFEIAEILKKQEKTTEALEHYEVAARNLPKCGRHRLLILREYGLVMRASGCPEGHEKAVDLLERALKVEPGDEATRGALAQTLLTCGFAKRVVEVAAPLLEGSSRSQEVAVAVLTEAHRVLGERLAYEEVRRLAETWGLQTEVRPWS